MTEPQLLNQLQNMPLLDMLELINDAIVYRSDYTLSAAGELSSHAVFWQQFADEQAMILDAGDDCEDS